jgi:hypothetical protein
LAAFAIFAPGVPRSAPRRGRRTAPRSLSGGAHLPVPACSEIIEIERSLAVRKAVGTLGAGAKIVSHDDFYGKGRSER